MKIQIYQVLPRLFGNTNATNKPNGTIEENGSGKLADFSKKALAEIKKMGYTHIWYTGLIEHATKTDYSEQGIAKDHPAVVKGMAGSPYAIKDYFDIDPDLATQVSERMREFESLIERTHQAGLKVVIDFVPNHVARQYRSDVKPKGICDLGENDNPHTSFDRNNNFYYIPGQKWSPDFDLSDHNGIKYEEYPAKATGNDRFDAHPGIYDWYETTKLNYGIDYLGGHHCHFNPVPDTWHKMLQILLFWASKKTDVFRCDMAEMVPVEFWGWVIPQVKKKYQNIDFIAEIYNPDAYRAFIWDGKFDYLYDKVGLYDTLRRIIRGEQSAAAITHCWQSLDDIRDKMLYFLENHDEQRIASDFFAGNPKKAFPAMVVAAALYTNPLMVYSGQELGERGMDAEGFSGKNGRTSIFDYWSVESLRKWYNDGQFGTKNLTKEQKEIRNFYHKLLNLCHEEKAISNGVSYDLMYTNYNNPNLNPEKQFAFMRQSEEEILLIIANFDDEDSNTAVFLPAHAFEYMKIKSSNKIMATNLFSGEKINTALNPDSYIECKVPANHGVILKFYCNL
ncbi:MAG: alpha amylase C-terminal domain-containing protein [Dysgonamonadaceae bacterium]|jgi:glycosidase|nr:alpha amylase C-terminal domain-containing protein [Dysgonamonadaceae bacterium]